MIDAHRDRDRQDAKRRATLQALAASIIACFLWMRFGKELLASLVFATAVLIVVSGLWIPRLFERIDSVGRKLAHIVGEGLTWILLTVCYYLIFVPVRIGAALTHKDPLSLQISKKRLTYWEPHDVSSSNRYRRQY